jgi:hypothetical protein
MKKSIHISLIIVAGLIGMLSMVLLGSITGLCEPIWWGGKALFPLLFGLPSIAIGSFATYLISRYLLKKIAGDIFVQKQKNGIFISIGYIAGVIFWPAVFIPRVLGLSVSMSSYGEFYISVLVFLLTGIVLSAIIASIIIGTILKVLYKGHNHGVLR